MDSRLPLLRRPIAIVFLSLALGQASASYAQRVEFLSDSDRSLQLTHPEYRIRSFDTENFRPEKQRVVIGELAGLVRKTSQKGLKRVQAYFDLARLIRSNFGHHDVAFSFLDRAEAAISFVSKKELAKAGVLLVAITDLRERMARERLAALQGEWEFEVNREIILIPTNSELKVYDSSFKKAEKVFARFFIGSPVLLDVDRGYIKIARKLQFGRKLVDRELWIKPSESTFRAIAIRPPGFEVFLEASGHWSLANFVVGHSGSKNRLATPKLGQIYKVAYLEEFSKKFPALAVDAQILIDDLSFRAVVEEPSEEAARKYIKRLGDQGRHYVEVEKILHDSLWMKAADAKSIWLFEKYLSEYPEGENATIARDQIDELTFRNAQNVDEFLKYLESYPHGRFAAAAGAKLDGIRFEKAKTLGKLALLSFTETYPESSLVESAKAEIARIEFDEEFARSRKLNLEENYRELLARQEGAHRRQELELIVSSFEISRSPTVKACSAFFASFRLASFRELKYRDDYKPEYDAVIEALASIVIQNGNSRSGGIEAHTLLYDEIKEPGILYKAWNDNLARDADEEYQLIKRFPTSKLEKIFAIRSSEDPQMGQGWDVTLLGNVSTAKPRIPAVVHSTTRFTGIRMKVRMSLEVDYIKKWGGITWFEPEDSATKYWSKTFDSEVWFEIPANSKSRLEWFEFEEFETSRDFGIPVAGWRTRATVNDPEIKILDIARLFY